MKKSVLLVVLLGTIFFGFLTSFVSAEIMLSDSQSVYNLGDMLSVSATVKESADTDGFFQMFLLCDGIEQEFYKQYLILTSGQEKKVDADFLFRESSLGFNHGNCT